MLQKQVLPIKKNHTHLKDACRLFLLNKQYDYIYYIITLSHVWLITREHIYSFKNQMIVSTTKPVKTYLLPVTSWETLSYSLCGFRNVNALLFTLDTDIYLVNLGGMVLLKETPYYVCDYHYFTYVDKTLSLLRTSDNTCIHSVLNVSMLEYSHTGLLVQYGGDIYHYTVYYRKPTGIICKYTFLDPTLILYTPDIIRLKTRIHRDEYGMLVSVIFDCFNGNYISLSAHDWCMRYSTTNASVDLRIDIRKLTSGQAYINNIKQLVHGDIFKE
jgi:hypothetical protein